MPPSRPALTTSTWAIILIIATGTVLAGMDGAAKYLALELPIVVVLWGRYFFHTILTFAMYAGRTRSLAFLKARRPGLQFIRAAALFGATSFMYVAITRMQLADATSIQYLAPVLITAFSGLVLGERVGPRRWIAVVFGFIGVLLVARPGSGAIGWSALLPLGTAALLAVYMMMTRIIHRKDHPAATTIYSTALGALALSLLVPFFWQDLTAFQWAVMVAMGAAGALGHFFLIRAFFWPKPPCWRRSPMPRSLPPSFGAMSSSGMCRAAGHSLAPASSSPAACMCGRAKQDTAEALISARPPEA